ncbi:MAG TPA: hypothetical protein VHX60_05850 [Acidobacteriaceae bacterium]|jgi:hypothetical protein|nr:hypothetical protein [Acidobacteriaceae bacterium]
MRLSPSSLRFAIVALAGMLALSGCGKGNQPQAASSNPPQAASPAAPTTQTPAPVVQTPPPPPVVVPAGTKLRVRLDEALGSRISQTGERFHATVSDDVIVAGMDVIPQGSHADGTVIAAKSLGHFRGGALLELRLERIRTDSGDFAVATSTMERTEKGKGRRTAKFAGGGGALGAILGGLAGGGKGALIGAAVGAGAGTAGSAVTGNREIVLPVETLITFRLERPVQLTK